MDLQDHLASQAQQDTSMPSAKPPIGARCSLEAAGDGWGLTVLWKTNELTRYVDWKKGNAGFALALPLRRRPSPWTYTNGGTTQTKYGPYQPALTHREGGKPWRVVMSHEKVDFPAEQDLLKVLQWKCYRDPAQTAVSPDGHLVSLRADEYPEGGSLGITIYTLSINGEPPPADVLEPFLMGAIRFIGEEADPGRPP